MSVCLVAAIRIHPRGSKYTRSEYLLFDYHLSKIVENPLRREAGGLRNVDLAFPTCFPIASGETRETSASAQSLKGSAIVAASDVRSEKLVLGRKATAKSEETPTEDHEKLFGSDARESTEGMHAGTVLYIASLLRVGAEPEPNRVSSGSRDDAGRTLPDAGCASVTVTFEPGGMCRGTLRGGIERRPLETRQDEAPW